MEQSYFFFVVSKLTIMNANNPKTVRCAGFDIGSGSTKMTIADVNIECQTISIVSEDASKVSYKKDLEKEGNGFFSDYIIKKGSEVLQKMKQKAEQLGATEFFGVATAAFRSANNSQIFLDNLKNLGINTEVITQAEEAFIGYYATIADEHPTKHDSLVVWDIGGGSMQWTYVDDEGSLKFHGIDLGAETFARRIIYEFQQRDLSQTDSPNPIGHSTATNIMKQIVHEIKNSFGEDIPLALVQRLNQHDTFVVGIGGVHGKSIRDQLKKKIYDITDVYQYMMSNFSKTDEEIGGDYARTQIANLLLVFCYMDALTLTKVKTKNTSLAHGLLHQRALLKCSNKCHYTPAYFTKPPEKTSLRHIAQQQNFSGFFTTSDERLVNFHVTQ